MQTGAIPSVACLFVSHLNGTARHHDYTCNEGFARFIAEDVVAWARAGNHQVPSGDHLICGVSLSGLASAHTALMYPSVFSYVLCQSGSFWWSAGKKMSWRRTTAKFWLSVGSDETVSGVSHSPTGLFQKVSQLEGVEMAVTTLESLGASVRYSRFDGGHSFASWRKELAPALRWLLGTTP